MKWLILENHNQNYQTMIWQGWCWIIKVKLIQCWKLLKMKFVSWKLKQLVKRLLATYLNVFKLWNENGIKMSNIREGSVWRYQTSLVASTTILWKKQFWTYFRNSMPLQMSKIVMKIYSNWLLMPLRKLLRNSQNRTIYIEC